MRKLLKWTVRLVGGLVLLAVVAYGMAYYQSNRMLARTFVVQDPPLVVTRDAAALATGEHLFKTRGCADCHGADGAGKLVFDGGPVLKLVAPNITPGGIAGQRNADQLATAIRHGVRPDGRPLVFMPSEDFHEMGDTDVAALIAYLQSLPASTNDPGKLEIRPLGRMMAVYGSFPLTPADSLDHTPRTRVAPAIGPTAEYGAYLAHGCTGCHGPSLAGQHVPGTPPSFPDAANLTPAGELGQWNADQFRTALRTGKRPDGSGIDPFMPWQAFSKMSDDELGALWAHLRSLPPAQGTARPRKTKT